MQSFIRLLLPFVGLCCIKCSSLNREMGQSASGFSQADFANKTFTLSTRSADSPMAGKSIALQFDQELTGRLRMVPDSHAKQVEVLMWWVSGDSLSLVGGGGLYTIKGKIEREGKGFLIKRKGGDLLLTP